MFFEYLVCWQYHLGYRGSRGLAPSPDPPPHPPEAMTFNESKKKKKKNSGTHLTPTNTWIPDEIYDPRPRHKGFLFLSPPPYHEKIIRPPPPEYNRPPPGNKWLVPNRTVPGQAS